MSEPQSPKILKPNQIEIPLKEQIVKLGDNLQINMQTPEGRQIIIMIQMKDYNWEKDTFILNVGQLDLTEAARRGQLVAPPKGIIH